MLRIAAAVCALLIIIGCSPFPRYTIVTKTSEKSQAEPSAVKPRVGSKIIGLASFYADYFHGRKTANGETFDMYGLTAAHKTLPFNTWLEVTNLSNGRTVTVRINDRGPFVGKRIIDLSYKAAQELRMIETGVQEVEIEILKYME
ncbi:septal ring lytic transglycosylase RlpA family protein [Candidatus Latescibacterota bacterium]